MDYNQGLQQLLSAQAAQPLRMRNAMTVDVEDYFQVSAFDPYVSRDQWSGMQPRVEQNVNWILEMCEKADLRITFFVLGWIAHRFPQLVRRLHDAGHEVASHGYAHQRLSELTEEELLADVSKAKAVLEDIIGAPVLGYRAPSFSIGPGTTWAWDVLDGAGYRYSSSVYPIAHDHYGMVDAPRFAFYPTRNRGLLELPITTVRMLDLNLPAGGGGYFRLLPYAVSRWMIHRVNADDASPCIFYFHPWEIDPAQPRPQCLHRLDRRTRFRHYLNLHRMKQRVSALGKDFQWGRMDQIFLERA